MRRLRILRCIPAVLLSLPGVVRAQDGNFLHPPAAIAPLLLDSSFTISSARGSRAEGDRTSQMVMQFGDVVLLAKWAPAAEGGHAFNNEPRYEVAAYELQKLFLPAEEWVVPPTVMRAVPHGFVQEYFPQAKPTFKEAGSTVVLIQYWLAAVQPDDFWDEDRFESDSVYARYLGNMNILTHLIDHRDANVGNFLISRIPSHPRVFSVDNGVAFRSPRSDRGYAWRNLRVERLPHATVERLRSITEESLTEALGVIAQFEVSGGLLVHRPRSANLDDGRGVRQRDGIVQFGLTDGEIRDVANRIRRLLERVDKGDIEVF